MTVPLFVIYRVLCFFPICQRIRFLSKWCMYHYVYTVHHSLNLWLGVISLICFVLNGSANGDWVSEIHSRDLNEDIRFKFFCFCVLCYVMRCNIELNIVLQIAKSCPAETCLYVLYGSLSCTPSYASKRPAVWRSKQEHCINLLNKQIVPLTYHTNPFFKRF